MLFKKLHSFDNFLNFRECAFAPDKIFRVNLQRSLILQNLNNLALSFLNFSSNFIFWKLRRLGIADIKFFPELSKSPFEFIFGKELFNGSKNGCLALSWLDFDTALETVAILEAYIFYQFSEKTLLFLCWFYLPYDMFLELLKMTVFRLCKCKNLKFESQRDFFESIGICCFFDRIVAGRIHFCEKRNQLNKLLFNLFETLNFEEFLYWNLEVKSDKSKRVHIVLAELSHNRKKLQNLFVLEVEIELEKVNRIKSFFMSVFGDHELRVLEAILMFEVNSVFHFLKLSAHFLAKLKVSWFVQY